MLNECENIRAKPPASYHFMPFFGAFFSFARPTRVCAPKYTIYFMNKL